MDQVMQYVEPAKQFAKDSIRLVKRCTKPDRKGNNMFSFCWLCTVVHNHQLLCMHSVVTISRLHSTTSVLHNPSIGSMYSSRQTSFVVHWHSHIRCTVYSIL